MLKHIIFEGKKWKILFNLNLKTAAIVIKNLSNQSKFNILVRKNSFWLENYFLHRLISQNSLWLCEIRIKKVWAMWECFIMN